MCNNTHTLSEGVMGVNTGLTPSFNTPCSHESHAYVHVCVLLRPLFFAAQAFVFRCFASLIKDDQCLIAGFSSAPHMPGSSGRLSETLMRRESVRSAQEVLPTDTVRTATADSPRATRSSGVS